MLQDLADKVWRNPRFHKAAKAIEKAWLANEFKLEDTPSVTEHAASRAISASAILSCSANTEHRIAALRLSTYIFELFEESNLPFDAALRVVLTRLGNFPAISTRSAVSSALSNLPWTLAAEEISISDAKSIRIRDRSETLTDFQHLLWHDLSSKSSVAFSAPTSAGKSFVLELYLSSLFASESKRVIYLVPTRALITQVSTELASLFRRHAQTPPDIVTVPLRADSKIPNQAIYVMTQERAHLSLQSNSNFYADVVVVDEAHSISEGGRGILLQSVIEDALTKNPHTQILSASPTTRNLETFGRLFRLSNIVERTSKDPTVSQNFLIAKPDREERTISLTAARENGRQTLLGVVSTPLPLRTRIDQLAHIPAALCGGQANLIYANGADEAEDIALRISKQFEINNPDRELVGLAKLVRESVHPSYVLADCVLKGIGFHYANIPTQLRQEIERAFSKGHLKYLACTSTLLQGVNLPAKNIFMLKPTKGQGKPLESADFWNLAGRAGRLGREFQGNIFLIDYSEWPRQSLREAKDAEISPAIEKSITQSTEALLNTINAKRVAGGKSKKIEMESAFVRLITDFKDSKLEETLSRLEISAKYQSELKQALQLAASKISLPPHILKRTYNVSAHKQQALYKRIKERIESEPDRIDDLVPRHPIDPQSFNSYASILQLCHEIVLEIDTTKKLYRYHALLARRWMLGWSVPRIVSARIRREEKLKKKKITDTRKIIRDTLETLENDIRFQTIRLFGCYKTILEYALSEADALAPEARIPDVELFLEIGASNKTTVSLISLGLSRATAIRITGARSELDGDLGLDEALEWLRAQTDNFESFGLSPIQIEEVKDLLSKTQSNS